MAAAKSVVMAELATEIPISWREANRRWNLMVEPAKVLTGHHQKDAQKKNENKFIWPFLLIVSSKRARCAKNDGSFYLKYTLENWIRWFSRKLSGSWAFKFPFDCWFSEVLFQPALHGHWKMFQFHPGLPDIIMEVEDGFPQDKVSFRIGSLLALLSLWEEGPSHDQEMAVSKMIRFKAGIEIKWWLSGTSQHRNGSLKLPRFFLHQLSTTKATQMMDITRSNLHVHGTKMTENRFSKFWI